MLTPAEKAHYVHHAYAKCPYCKGNQLEGGSYDGDGKCIAQKMECLTCGKTWKDIYILTDIEEEDD